MNSNVVTVLIILFFSINGLLLATDGTEKKAADVSWIQVAKDLNKNAMIMGLTSAADGKVYSGSAGKGTYVTTDNGTTWLKKTMGDADHDNGFTMAVFAHPNGKVYAGQSNGMVSVSNDNGETFESLCSFSSNDPSTVSFADDAEGNVYFIYASGESEIYDPDNTNLKTNMVEQFDCRIWSMEVDKQGNMYVSTWGEGIYKSTDMGDTWFQVNNGLSALDVHKIAAADNGTLFAGLSGTGGLYRSTDGGQSWVPSMNGLGLGIVMDIIIIDDSTMFAATTDDIFRSDDFGNNWISIKGDLPDLTNYRRITLDTKKYLYVGSMTGKIYRTSDPVEVETDFLSIKVMPEAAVMAAPGDKVDYTITVRDYQNQPVNNAGIKVDDGINNTTQNIYTNEQGVAEFNVVIPDNTNNGSYEIKFTASKQGYSTSQKLIRRIEVQNQNVWSKISSYDYTNRILSILNVGKDSIFLGTSGSSMIASTNSGQSWYYASNGISMINSVFKIERDSEGSIFISTDWDGILKTTDFGMSWTKPETGFDRASCIDIDRNDNIMAADYNEHTLYRSSDKGSTWHQLDNFPSVSAVHDIMCYYDTFNDKIFVAAGTDGILYSSDNGNSWMNISNGINNISIKLLAHDNQGNLYAGTEDRGVYISTDGGTNWSSANSGMNNYQITEIVTDNNQLFALSFGNGIWLSTDKGTSWQQFNEGLENMSFLDLYSFSVSDDGFLYAGAFDQGLYKRKNPKIPSGTGNTEDIHFNLNAYPNPSSGIINITYSIPEPELVTLSIMNIYGEEIAKPVANKILDADSYNNIFNARDLTDGIYFCCLKAGSRCEMLKLLIVR